MLSSKRFAGPQMGHLPPKRFSKASACHLSRYQLHCIVYTLDWHPKFQAKKLKMAVI